MRLMCSDFLRKSIGPTVQRLASDPYMTGEALAYDGTGDDLECERIMGLVVDAFTDIYSEAHVHVNGALVCTRTDGSDARCEIPE